MTILDVVTVITNKQTKFYTYIITKKVSYLINYDLLHGHLVEWKIYVEIYPLNKEGPVIVKIYIKV